MIFLNQIYIVMLGLMAIVCSTLHCSSGIDYICFCLKGTSVTLCCSIHVRYGDGEFKIWLSDLQCTGEEGNLLECPRELNYDLNASRLTAGLKCTNDTDYRSGK